MVYRHTLLVILLLFAFTMRGQIHQRHLPVPDSATLRINEMFYPVDGVQVSGHHYRGGRYHHGLDISHNNRDTVKASWAGLVRYAKTGYNGGYGQLVIITHFNGLETYYAHLRELLVEERTFVKQGTPIGIVGSTGNSLGPHLHFEVRYRGLSMNPNDLIDRHYIQLKRNGHIYKVTK